MTTKLTLTIEEDVIKAAKKYAESNGRSLSDIVENYLKVLKTSEQKSVYKFSPKVKRLKGVISLPEDLDYKKVMTEELVKKYLGK
jgi:hypothetical protein